MESYSLTRQTMKVNSVSALVRNSAVAALCALRALAADPTFAPAVNAGTVSIRGLTEASGIVASRNHPNVLWTHNDANHPAEIFALDTHGRLLGTYKIPGNKDNEDIAIGPGPVAGVSFLYVGDIGDNDGKRAHIKVYQIPEPPVYSWQFTNPIAARVTGARTITLRYPDGPRDAEAMFVDPITGDLFIASKQSRTRIYLAPKAQLDSSDSFVLKFVRTLNFKSPSAGDISPSGNEIIIRRENSAALWKRSPGQSVSDALGGRAIPIPVAGPKHGEPNGEAICFDSRGSGYYTLSDNTKTQPLRYFARTSPEGPPSREK